MPDDDCLVKIYGYETYREGKNMVTDMGNITLLHTDNPTHETIKSRIEEAVAEEDHDLEDDCHLCQSMKGKPYTLVYTGDDY